ncbi:DUF3592 domain-containing protein [Colwellia sp. RE-S-Sl-9]
MEFDGGVVISALINIAIAIYLLFLLFSYRSYLWHKTEAVITKSELKGTYDSDGDMMYGPEIEYEYFYDGRKYINDYVAVAVGSSNIKSQAEDILGAYGKGWKVDVYVNPRKPSKSILAPGIRVHHLYLLGFLIFGFYFWVPAGWNFWSYVSSQNSNLYAEVMIPIELDAPKIEKLKVANSIRANLLGSDIKAKIQKEYNYITPMAMDEGFQLTVKEDFFSNSKSSKAVQLVCSFEHPSSKNYPKTVTKACHMLVEKELKKYNKSLKQDK